MKLQELTLQTGVNVKKMSETVKTTAEYLDYYYLI